MREVETPPDLQLLRVAVAQREPAEGELDRLAHSVTNWAAARERITWHRCTSIAWPRLRTVTDRMPAETADHLRTLVRDTSMAGLRHAAELARLARAFEDAGIEFLALKDA